MKKKYGSKKAKKVFYASRNKKTITGVEESVFNTYRTMAYLLLGEEISDKRKKDLKKTAELADPHSERGKRMAQASKEEAIRMTGIALSTLSPTEQAQHDDIMRAAHQRDVDRATGKRGTRR